MMIPQQLLFIMFFGLILALMDMIALPITQIIFSNSLPLILILIPMIIYSFQALIFYFSLNVANMTIMNIIWDVTSDIMVTLIGVFVLKESINYMGVIGIILGILSIIITSISTLY